MINKLFLVIGAQKAGTSWLHSTLKQDNRFAHASLYFEHVKEVHYFDYLYDNHAGHINNWRAYYFIQMVKNRGMDIAPIISDWLAGDKNKIVSNSIYNKFVTNRLLQLTDKLDDSWYENLLKCHGQQEYSLDITPDYSVIGEEGFRHIKKISKDVKLLFVLRNPVERAWSGVLQDRKSKEGGVRKFVEQEFNDAELEKLFKECSTGLNVGSRTNYVKTLQDVTRAGLFDNLKISFYDDISINPELFIDKLYDFIGLDNSSLKKDKGYVESLTNRVYVTEHKASIPLALKEKLIAYYKPMVEELENQYQLILPKSWHDYFFL